MVSSRRLRLWPNSFMARPPSIIGKLSSNVVHLLSSYDCSDRLLCLSEAIGRLMFREGSRSL